MTTDTLVHIPLLVEGETQHSISLTVHPDVGAFELRTPVIPRGEARLNRLIFVPDARSDKGVRMVVSDLKMLHHNDNGTVTDSPSLFLSDGYIEADDFRDTGDVPVGLRCYPVLRAGKQMRMMVSVRGNGGKTAKGAFFVEVKCPQATADLFRDLRKNIGRRPMPYQYDNAHLYNDYRNSEDHIDLNRYLDAFYGGTRVARNLVSAPMHQGRRGGDASPIVRLTPGDESGVGEIVSLFPLDYGTLRPIGLRVRTVCDEGCRIEVSDLHFAGRPSLLPTEDAWVDADSFSARHQLRRLLAHPDQNTSRGPLRLRVRAVGDPEKRATIIADMLCEIVTDDAFNPQAFRRPPGPRRGIGRPTLTGFPPSPGRLPTPALPSPGMMIPTPAAHMPPTDQVGAPLNEPDFASPQGAPSGPEIVIPLQLRSGDSPLLQLKDHGVVYELACKPLPWGMFRLIGVSSDFDTSDPHAFVEVREVRIGGSPNLFVNDSWMPVSALSLGERNTPTGLRSFPVVCFPNAGMLQIRLNRPPGSDAEASGHIDIIAEVLEDESMHHHSTLPAMKRPVGPKKTGVRAFAFGRPFDAGKLDEAMSIHLYLHDSPTEGEVPWSVTGRRQARKKGGMSRSDVAAHLRRIADELESEE